MTSLHLLSRRLDPNWVNPLDNGIVFVEMGPREPAKLGHLIRTGQFLGAFFAWCEQMLRLVLAQERASGRRSAAVCLFDMQQVHIWQYASPLGAVNRMFEVWHFLTYGWQGKITDLIWHESFDIKHCRCASTWPWNTTRKCSPKW